MIAFVKRLDEAGAALDRHDPETALTLLQSLEDGGRTLDQADAARCRRLVQRMATIAEAQRQGIKAAIDGVTAARRAAATAPGEPSDLVRFEPLCRGFDSPPHGR